MNLANLFDPASAAIVCGGTLLATVLRCGPANCLAAAGAVAGLGRSTFDADSTRAEMAVQVREIQKGGVLRTEPHRTGDRAFDEASGALIGNRSVKALLATHEVHKARRVEYARCAVSTLAQAAELAPVFGLAGTLLSLSQLPADGLAKGAFAGAISMAVLTTLYGLLLANLLLAPLARMVERKAAEEEAERQQIVDWLAGHLERSMAPVRPRPAPLEDAA
jgi:chemotaxis protein MotA